MDSEDDLVDLTDIKTSEKTLNAAQPGLKNASKGTPVNPQQKPLGSMAGPIPMAGPNLMAGPIPMAGPNLMAGPNPMAGSFLSGNSGSPFNSGPSFQGMQGVQALPGKPQEVLQPMPQVLNQSNPLLNQKSAAVDPQVKVNNPVFPGTTKPAIQASNLGFKQNTPSIIQQGPSAFPSMGYGPSSNNLQSSSKPLQPNNPGNIVQGPGVNEKPSSSAPNFLGNQGNQPVISAPHPFGIPGHQPLSSPANTFGIPGHQPLSSPPNTFGIQGHQPLSSPPNTFGSPGNTPGNQKISQTNPDFLASKKAIPSTNNALSKVVMQFDQSKHQQGFPENPAKSIEAPNPETHSSRSKSSDSDSISDTPGKNETPPKVNMQTSALKPVNPTSGFVPKTTGNEFQNPSIPPPPPPLILSGSIDKTITDPFKANPSKAPGFSEQKPAPVILSGGMDKKVSDNFKPNPFKETGSSEQKPAPGPGFLKPSADGANQMFPSSTAIPPVIKEPPPFPGNLGKATNSSSNFPGIPSGPGPSSVLPGVPGSSLGIPAQMAPNSKSPSVPPAPSSSKYPPPPPLKDPEPMQLDSKIPNFPNPNISKFDVQPKVIIPEPAKYPQSSEQFNGLTSNPPKVIPQNNQALFKPQVNFNVPTSNPPKVIPQNNQAGFNPQVNKPNLPLKNEVAQSLLIPKRGFSPQEKSQNKLIPKKPSEGFAKLGKMIPKNEINILIVKVNQEQVHKTQIEVINLLARVIDYNKLIEGSNNLFQFLKENSNRGSEECKKTLEFFTECITCKICKERTPAELLELRCKSIICRACLKKAAVESIEKKYFQCPDCRKVITEEEQQFIMTELKISIEHIRKEKLENKLRTKGQLKCRKCERFRKNYWPWCLHLCKECFAFEVRKNCVPCQSCHESVEYDKILGETFKCRNCEQIYFFIGSYGKYVYNETHLLCVQCVYDYFNQGNNTKLNIKLSKAEKIEINDHLFQVCSGCSSEFFRDYLEITPCGHYMCRSCNGSSACRLCSS
jgi:hypothetical protein